MSRLYRKNRDLSERLERVELRVDQPDDGERFDRFLAKRLTWRSRAGVQQLIEEGRALLNGAKRKPATKLKAGDAVVVEVVREGSGEPAADPEITVLFEDDHLMALDKPAGAVVHPVGAHQEGTLLQALHRRTPEAAPLPKLIHRIDQFTSGVLLVAKTDAVRAAFSDMLERGSVHKTYDALVLGRVAFDHREVDAPIGPVGDSRILMRVDPAAGKPARSAFTVEERFRFATWTSVSIATGRTHQIRVHAAHFGHPLLGDHLYGDGLAPEGFERFALHARRVSFDHPATGAHREIEAPLPEPFRQAVAVLRGG